MGGKGPPRPSSSESDDWGDESWIVDCPCGVNYDDGEEMVECDECGVWVHTSCCRVTKGLPTYVCDKCKVKKKLKESEESEVAQLLADLPSKGVSFEDRNHGKGGGLISGHHNSSEIPIEERAHVHGIPGGDPSFFVGAPDVFCRQLWKYSGHVPKLLKLEYKELPEPREEVLELLRDLKVCDVPMFFDTDRRLAPLALENGHAGVTTVDLCNSREEVVSKVDAQVKEETPKDKQGKSLQVRKSEGKHNKHKHKPKVKEDKPHHHVKRDRDEGDLKEQSSKKKLRANGDHKPEGGDVQRPDVPPFQEASVLSKSPLSSPKNPKAMKKMAVQEFMDGDMILCSVCGKVEPILDGTTGASSGGASDSFCRECEKLRRRSSPLSSKQETGSVKQEPVVIPAPARFESGVTCGLKSVSQTEVDYREVGTEGQWLRLRADTRKDAEIQTSPDGDQQGNLRKNKVDNGSPTDLKKVDVEVTSHKITGMYEYSKGRDEKRKPSVKVEPPNGLTVNHPSVIPKNGEILEALELPAVRTIVAAKAPGESAARAEDLRQDGAHVVAGRTSCADDTETRTAGDTSNAVSGNQQAVSVEGYLPVSSSDISSKSVPSTRVSGTIPLVPGIPGPVMADPADGKDSPRTILQDRVVPPVVTETVEDKVSKVPPSTMSMETKSQGSARTAGHLPASVRGKMHGERGMYLQRSISHAAVQTQASSLSGQPLVQVPLQVHTSVATSVSPSAKGSSGEDPVSGKHDGQVQQESISPVGQGSKQGQPSRLHIAPTIVAQKSPAGLSEILLSPSQPPSSAQRTETDQQQLPSKVQPKGVEPSRHESSMQAVSPKEPKVATGFNSDTQVSKPTGSAQVTPTPVFCQQARQLNGIGHVYVSRKSLNKDPSGTLTSQALISTVSNKLSVSSLKSPSSGTSSSSPTSPLVTTPSSKPQPSVKVTEPLQTHKSLPGGAISNASAPHSSSKMSGPMASTVSSSKQVGTLQSSKSIPSPASPPSTKGVSMSKQSSRSNSLPVTKSVDGNNSVSRSNSGVMSSRGLNHTGSSSNASAKENAKNISHTSSKTVSKATAQPAGTKPPSSGKSSHSVAPTKGLSVSKHHSGPGSGASKSSSTPSTAKHTSSHHSKSGSLQKDEKSSMPSAPPIPKAMATMPPPPPQVSTKRSPPTGLTSAVATTLKDEELAMLLHQELNSSPRVPRIPRVRQAGVSLQLVSSPSLSSAKGSFGSYGSGGPSHKDHHPAPRKRTREDRHKDASEEVSKSGRKRSEENRMDDEKVSSERAGHNGAVDSLHSKEKSTQGSGEGNSRHHGFAKGNLSIIVPGNDDTQDGDKKSPAHSNVLTLPGLIDEVLSSRDHQLSYEDVCEAVLPHWPKLRKPNGERYAYPSHRQAVLDCLRNRPAWAHLVGRGPKTNSGRKRRRNEIKSFSDSDEEENEHVGFRDSDDLDTGKYSKRRKELDRDKRAGDASERQKNSDAEDVRKVGRPARRRRRVDIDDGTDGEDEPTNATEKAVGRQPEVSKSDDETSQEEEPEADFSPSSEEEDEASNYSTDDEEMVVHRGIRNRRRRSEESSSSEDDVD